MTDYALDKIMKCTIGVVIVVVIITIITIALVLL